MKESEITLKIQLDEKHVPEKISWSATDKPDGALSETKAFALSIWDQEQFNTMRMDLWTKEMTVNEMKKFCVDTIGAMSDSIKNATGDTKMAELMQDCCNKMTKHINEES